jgi:hypothetical protein
VALCTWTVIYIPVVPVNSLMFRITFISIAVPFEHAFAVTSGLSRGRFRTEGRTMAAEAFMTWTHYSVLFEVT